MKEPPKYQRHVDGGQALAGFSAIASNFWLTAEKLRHEAEQETVNQRWRIHTSTHSGICLYHAALDCFINEEITFLVARGYKNRDSDPYKIQGNTLNITKINEFFDFFGVGDKASPEVKRRTVLLINLRNRLGHHWPVLRDVRDYPVQVIDALTDAKIERVNTSWAAQCGDVRLFKWAAERTRAFIYQWWAIGRSPDEVERLAWDYGPERKYPEVKPSGDSTPPSAPA